METGVRWEVGEAALAQVVDKKIEAADARSGLLERRCEVMAARSDYVSKAE